VNEAVESGTSERPQGIARGAGRYLVVVPVRSLDDALPEFEAPSSVRRALALGFAQDRLVAATRARQVRDVLVVTPDPVVAEAARAIGAQVQDGDCGGDVGSLLVSARKATGLQERPGPTAVLLGTLPCLLPAELDQALRSPVQGRVEILDFAGLRPTLLASTTGWPKGGTLAPPEPALRAAWLAARELLPGLACDVGTLEGLRVAGFLGVGPATDFVLNDLAMPGLSWRCA
jgi:2-phospho-L-lactate guanylyltransferase